MQDISFSDSLFNITQKKNTSIVCLDEDGFCIAQQGTGIPKNAAGHASNLLMACRELNPSQRPTVYIETDQRKVYVQGENNGLMICVYKRNEDEEDSEEDGTF